MYKTFKYSKIKILIGLTIFLSVLMISIMLIVNPIVTTHSLIYNSKEIVVLVGVLGAIFSIFIIWKLVIALFAEHALKIDSNGLYINNLQGKSKYVPWDEFLNIDVVKYASLSSLIIYVSKHEKYISQESSFYKYVLRKNYETFGSPITFTNLLISNELYEVKKALDVGFDNWRKTNQKIM
jgi:hypothetical protein